jgi:ABC-2 type transport system ATP-binding protein
MSVLRVENLKKTYKRNRTKVYALKGISFKIEAGTVTGFLGANGAGKTTTIKCLLELAFADEGQVFYFDKPGLSNEAKSKIGFLPERPYFYEYLTGREFLKFYGEISTQLSRKDLNLRISDLLKRVGLDLAADRQLRSYSKGMLQRVGIAQALIHDPEFVILDEPMTGLDPDGRFEVREIIRETAARGTAVFFSSHLLPDAEQSCDRLVILKLGELIYQGSTESLLSQTSSQYEMVWRENSNLRSEVIKTDEALQFKIDELRRNSFQIMEVKPTRLTLEQAFVKMAFDKKVTTED